MRRGTFWGIKIQGGFFRRRYYSILYRVIRCHKYSISCIDDRVYLLDAIDQVELSYHIGHESDNQSRILAYIMAEKHCPIQQNINRHFFSSSLLLSSTILLTLFKNGTDHNQSHRILYNPPTPRTSRVNLLRTIRRHLSRHSITRSHHNLEPNPTNPPRPKSRHNQHRPIPHNHIQNKRITQLVRTPARPRRKLRRASVQCPAPLRGHLPRLQETSLHRGPTSSVPDRLHLQSRLAAHDRNPAQT